MLRNKTHLTNHCCKYDTFFYCYFILYMHKLFHKYDSFLPNSWFIILLAKLIHFFKWWLHLFWNIFWWDLMHITYNEEFIIFYLYFYPPDEPYSLSWCTGGFCPAEGANIPVKSHFRPVSRLLPESLPTSYSISHSAAWTLQESSSFIRIWSVVVIFNRVCYICFCCCTILKTGFILLTLYETLQSKLIFKKKCSTKWRIDRFWLQYGDNIWVLWII